MYFFFAHHLHKIVANEQLRSQDTEKIRQPNKVFSMYFRIDKMLECTHSSPALDQIHPCSNLTPLFSSPISLPLYSWILTLNTTGQSSDSYAVSALTAKQADHPPPPVTKACISIPKWFYSPWPGGVSQKFAETQLQTRVRIPYHNLQTSTCHARRDWTKSNTSCPSLRDTPRR